MNIDVKKHIVPNLPYVPVFWFFAKLAGGFRLSAGTDVVDKTMAAISGFSNAVAQNPFPAFYPADILAGIAGAAAIRAAVYFKGRNAKKYRHGVEYGSARWSA